MNVRPLRIVLVSMCFLTLASWLALSGAIEPPRPSQARSSSAETPLPPAQQSRPVSPTELTTAMRTLPISDAAAHAFFESHPEIFGDRSYAESYSSVVRLLRVRALREANGLEPDGGPAALP
jgi:hypothetical protein